MTCKRQRSDDDQEGIGNLPALNFIYSLFYLQLLVYQMIRFSVAVCREMYGQDYLIIFTNRIFNFTVDYGPILLIPVVHFLCYIFLVYAYLGTYFLPICIVSGHQLVFPFHECDEIQFISRLPQLLIVLITHRSEDMCQSNLKGN